MEKKILNIIKEETNTLQNFFEPLKKQKLQQKKSKKQAQTRKRKQSTQLSIFSWLVKDQPKQHCLIVTLDKSLLLYIFRFLRLTQIMTLARTCSYFYDCSKSIWIDRDFFGEFQTDKFTLKQLKKVIEKSSRLSHIKQIKNIYSGKNLGSCRQKIKLRISESIPIPGTLLEVFEVSPKVHRNIAFLVDNNLQEIVNSSYNSLKIINLSHCSYLQKFQNLSRCTSLINLSIISNDDEDLAKICKRCQNIQILKLIDCRNLNQNIFQSISTLENLSNLTLRGYKQPFQNVNKLSANKLLESIDLENSLIMDGEFIDIIKNCTELTYLSIKGCHLLTDDSIQFLAKYKFIKLQRLDAYRTQFSNLEIAKCKILNPNIFINIDFIDSLSL